MAKKAVRGERSHAIRDYLAANPEAGVNAVVAGLAEKGMTPVGTGRFQLNGVLAPL